MPRSLPPVFSFKRSMLSQLIFKSLICFELIFCIWCKVVVQFLSLACDCPVFLIPLMEKYFQCFCIICVLYISISVVINQHMCVFFFFWTFYSLPLIYVSVFMPVLYCLDYYSFVVLFEIRKHGTSSFVIFSQDRFSYSWFCSSINFRIVCSQFISVQPLSHVQLFLPHEPQHTKPPCPSPTPGAYSNSYPLSQ